MKRRLTYNQRRAIKRWSVLALSAAVLAGAFASIPYIVSALPDITRAARSAELPEAQPVFALGGGGVYPREYDFTAIEPEDNAEDTGSLPDVSDEVSFDPPEPGEDDFPVLTMNLCRYDSPDKAALLITNRTKYSVDLESFASKDFPLTGPIGDEPLVLVIHTHGSESYLRNGYEFYSSSEKFRSVRDESVTVVHIGDVLCERLSELGIPTYHDRTMYDTTDFNKSYTYSRKGINQALEKYPSIRFVIDLHRDSIFSSKGTNIKPIAAIDGKNAAQLMIVVGTDEGGANHPGWKTNLTVAAHLQQMMNGLYPMLARPVNLRSASFNQALTKGSLLLECGSCGNTVEEAEYAITLFAEAYACMLKDEYDR
ncbi:MAG: stage II sporulation protein P [Clostridia bacterium]|nr:stage II sporulation protein P [Clostridia bacterium]